MSYVLLFVLKNKNEKNCIYSSIQMCLNVHRKFLERDTQLFIVIISEE